MAKIAKLAVLTQRIKNHTANNPNMADKITPTNKLILSNWVAV